MTRLAEDELLRHELAYCVPLGIPHSHYLGGPNRWHKDDRLKASAWRLRDSQTCTGCNTRPEEWAANPDAYTAEVFDCEGCRMIALEQEKAAESPHLLGRRIRLSPATR